jgi:hypothetical protein
MFPAADRRRRQLLLVAGSGRSGTSLVTGLVGRLGFSIPAPEVAPDASNPRGFGESRWVVDQHNRLLKRLGMSPEDGRPEAWQEADAVNERLPGARDRLTRWLAAELDAAERVVVKDPRLTWFVPLWESVARELGCDVAVLTMLRHPAESVRSRELAYGAGSSATTRTASWLNMMLGLEVRTRGLSRAVVPYDRLLGDWQGALGAAEQGLGYTLVSDRTPAELERAGALVDSSLRRAEGDWAGMGVPTAVQELAERAHAALGGAGSPDTVGALEDLRADYAELYRWAADLTRSRVRAARVEERRKLDERTVQSARVSGGRSTP